MNRPIPTSTSNAWTQRREQGNWAWKPSRSMPETRAKSTPHSSSCWAPRPTRLSPQPIRFRWIDASRSSRSPSGNKLPVVGFVRQFAAVGGLLSYGPSISWMYRQAGIRRRTNSQGRESGRPACPATDSVRFCHQSYDSQCTWPRRAPDAASGRQRGDRVEATSALDAVDGSSTGT